MPSVMSFQFSTQEEDIGMLTNAKCHEVLLNVSLLIISVTYTKAL